MEKIEGTPEKNGDPSRIASYSAGLYALVALGKGILAWLSGSSALLADTIHGFSDTFASLLVLVGIWLSKRKSEAFPWGLYKVENFVALASTGLIFLAGYEIIRHVFEGERAFILGYFDSSLFGLLAIILAIAIFSRFEGEGRFSVTEIENFSDFLSESLFQLLTNYEHMLIIYFEGRLIEWQDRSIAGELAPCRKAIILSREVSL
jgi:hypothetical protein